MLPFTLFENKHSIHSPKHLFITPITFTQDMVVEQEREHTRFTDYVYPKVENCMYGLARERSLILGKGGLQKKGGGDKFYSYKERGAEKVLLMW